MKITTETVHRVNAFDLEKAIQDEYGVKEFDVVADLESSNDVSHTFSTSKSKEHLKLKQYDKEDITNFQATGNYFFLTGTLLQDMTERDLIPEGNYLVKVSW
jgi:hypothetical protein